MRTLVRSALRPMKKLLRRRLLGPQYADDYPPDSTADERTVISTVYPTFTMTSVERLLALVQAVRYIVTNGIPGAVVECGVWRGGSMMAVAQTLLAVGDTTRELYLYDTFEGMSPPTDNDRDYLGRSAAELMQQDLRERGVRCIADLDDVRRNLLSTGYPAERIHFIQGKVEDTIPGRVPAKIALARLDTDWYDSTKHELTHLYPRLQVGGILIIDDYGHWEGAQRATDEYFATHDPGLFLQRIDYTGRLAIKRA